jgi:hypothetical protein
MSTPERRLGRPSAGHERPLHAQPGHRPLLPCYVGPRTAEGKSLGDTVPQAVDSINQLLATGFISIGGICRRIT